MVGIFPTKARASMDHTNEQHTATHQGELCRVRSEQVWPYALGLGMVLALGLYVVRRSDGAFAELGIGSLMFVTYGLLAGLLGWAVARAVSYASRMRKTSGTSRERDERGHRYTRAGLIPGVVGVALVVAGFSLLLGLGVGTGVTGARGEAGLLFSDSAPSLLFAMAGLLIGIGICQLAEAWTWRLSRLRPSALIRATGIALLVVGTDQTIFTLLHSAVAGCALATLSALACCVALFVVDGWRIPSSSPNSPEGAMTVSALAWQPMERERRELLAALSDNAAWLIEQTAAEEVRLRDMCATTWISLASLAFCGFITGLTWDPVASEEVPWRDSAIDALGLLIGTVACACIVLLARHRSPEAARVELLVRAVQPISLAIVLMVPIVKQAIDPAPAFSLAISALSITGFAMSTSIAFLEITLVLRLASTSPERALPPLIALLGVSLGVGMISIDSLGSNGRVLCFVLEVILFTAVAISYAMRPRRASDVDPSDLASRPTGSKELPANGSPLSSAVHAAQNDPSGEQALTRRCRSVAERCGLSPRESEVLPYLGRGYGSTFIAENLGISENTVRTHVRHIYEKLGVSSREELIAYVDDIGKTQAHSEG